MHSSTYSLSGSGQGPVLWTEDSTSTGRHGLRQRCPYERQHLSHSFLNRYLELLTAFSRMANNPKAQPLSRVVHQLFISTHNGISYCDKYKAKRFRWQEAFASSKYRSSFSRAGCERNILSHPSRLMALTGHGWGKDFYSKLINFNQLQDTIF